MQPSVSEIPYRSSFFFARYTRGRVMVFNYARRRPPPLVVVTVFRALSECKMSRQMAKVTSTVSAKGTGYKKCIAIDPMAFLGANPNRFLYESWLAISTSLVYRRFANFDYLKE